MSDQSSDSDDADFVPHEPSDVEEEYSDTEQQVETKHEITEKEKEQQKLSIKEEARKKLEALKGGNGNSKESTQVKCESNIAEPREGKKEQVTKHIPSKNIEQQAKPKKELPEDHKSNLSKKKAPIKRKSPLDSLLAPKPTKISTLKASHSDWKSFVAEEGIEEDLKHHNKDG